MKYLLDTCVISELVKKEPHPAVIRQTDAKRGIPSLGCPKTVLAWARRMPDGHVASCSL
jgi:predicted nucleic acid-binding protein